MDQNITETILIAFGDNAYGNSEYIIGLFDGLSVILCKVLEDFQVCNKHNLYVNHHVGHYYLQLLKDNVQVVVGTVAQFCK